MLRTPLVQFLAVGLVLYLGVSWLGARSSGSPNGEPRAESDAAREILVDRERLLDFVQRRTREPDARTTQATFAALSAEARQDWIDRYVREEALVREARRLGLDRDDELIRRRLVQKIEFLTLGVSEGESRPSMDALAAYYRDHAETYRVPGSLSFSHVFVRSDAAGPAGEPQGGGSRDARARARAEALLAQLEREGVAPRDALGLGDRFLYNRNYEDRTLDEVRSHFGGAMAEALAQATPDATHWQGPFASMHGWHLVLLREREADRLPPFEEIEARVRADLSREKSEVALEAGLRGVVSRYRVELDPSLGSNEGAAAASAALD